MKKIFLMMAGTVLVYLNFSCKSSSSNSGGGSTVTPVSDLIKKTWSANIIKEASVVVYTKGAASNIRPGYAGYKLNLSTPPTAILTDFDGSTATGQYTLVSDTQLTLSGLTPAPTGTGGTISYTITTANASQLNLTRTSASQKTGNTINEYQLVNP